MESQEDSRNVYVWKNDDNKKMLQVQKINIEEGRGGGTKYNVIYGGVDTKLIRKNIPKKENARKVAVRWVRKHPNPN